MSAYVSNPKEKNEAFKDKMAFCSSKEDAGGMFLAGIQLESTLLSRKCFSVGRGRRCRQFIFFDVDILNPQTRGWHSIRRGGIMAARKIPQMNTYADQCTG